MNSLDNNACLCGSQQNYKNCCEPLLSGDKQADTPEQLMRSRFTAYAQKNAKYIYQTYASEKQAENPVKEIKEFATSCRFISLSVIDTNNDGDRGVVEFKANYFYQNLYCELHERSQFIKEQDQWRYLDGIIFPVADIKVGRNDDCPCGSNKKYKKCHSA
ncbi:MULTISPECIES: YchJ family metal-binding protein [unclassified Pseudoalteromonas]|uniref:YchJ family protein n=1 Tax=unclassified Pseudoalteromonas TaxID=194690 RepID=UPI0007300CA1|nr:MULTISPECIES: YchJ family metal-binding protein [unclassified Pseudoalteromonas]KTD97681.1 preprotein translocase subunit SecA [Pseudoalteromonas sp. H71]TMN79754.1 preprotein translocase subunit SecA [Pseudoalteromonas sp. S410]TMN92406.1 preprotein translocase subunit SecA [Pseudoalteromonas sp. S408]TMN95396.1 preprotein translocase subunit SecA [Pseudoalteromonas sp. S407]TMN95798.1 preprotein translocase subunit SecA [Pseudoalteromonas sp. S409]